MTSPPPSTAATRAAGPGLVVTGSHHGHAHLLSVAGDLDSAGSERVRASIGALLARHEDATVVVIDLRRVHLLTTAGLASLLATHQQFSKRLDLRILASAQVISMPLQPASTGARSGIGATRKTALAAESAENERLRTELHQRKAQLASQPVIEQAKGMLMHNFGLSSEDAFLLLRRLSQDTNMKLRTMAEHLVATLTGGVSAHAAQGVAATIEEFREQAKAAD